MTEQEIDCTYALSEIEDLKGEVQNLTTQLNDLTQLFALALNPGSEDEVGTPAYWDKIIAELDC